MVVLVWALVLVAIEGGRRGVVRLQRDRIHAIANLNGRSDPTRIAIPGAEGVRSYLRWLERAGARTRKQLFAMSASLVSGLLGLALVGPIGLAAGTAIGSVAPRIWEQRRRMRIQQELERQLAEIAESTAMAIRSGFSIAQALEFAAEEASPPMSTILDRFVQERRLGDPFDDALRRFADGLATADARLFTLVVAIHARSGGNLAGAVDEVASTIRHRIAVRRELRALSAQGRISGSILGALPIAFFLVLAATSRQELAPVYRSPAGIAMIASGLAMEGLAFVWIRKLLRVEA
ncbi:MAG TPA: type II secretion system F family protein [Myxococcaceae bacterium]|nr:type II secretion system F family protein [Myxococcaceae bacterium]